MKKFKIIIVGAGAAGVEALLSVALVVYYVVIF